MVQSREAWQTLATAFANPSRQCIMRLQERVVKIQGTRSIRDYAADVESAVYELSLLSQPVSGAELTAYILNDFPITAHIAQRQASIGSQSIRPMKAHFSQRSASSQRIFMASNQGYRGRCQLCSTEGQLFKIL